LLVHSLTLPSADGRVRPKAFQYSHAGHNMPVD
jgi:hypothetical protein